MGMKSDKKSSKINKPFPIVAIGASAGGLEAISKFLESVAPNLGIAYVIIQHLSPSYQSILPELLERKTKMKVFQVTDGMHVQPDCVYVIPPNAYMSIVDSKLTLSPRSKTDIGYHSIDHFLMALAPIYQNNAIAVILSGTATDGTEGIRAIKAEGGITFAQDESAKFRGMPDNAAYSGNVDFILPPEKIAQELESLVKLPYTGLESLEEISVKEQELRKIQVLLFKGWNVDFSSYKQTTITRRILRRMALNKIKDLEDYTKLLIKEPAEAALLYKDLLINVTSFFRDPSLYEELSKEILPSLMRGKKTPDVIRLWVAACSSGEEAYSIAICIFEYLSDHSLVIPIQLFASDLSEESIEKARAGIYSKFAVEKMSPERVNRFFVPIDGYYQVIKPIRDICVFATHNLLKDPPFSKLDLISCQNALIYLEPESQKRILQSFHYALKPTGYLLLGKSETIGKASDLFNAASKKSKLFTKKEATNIHYEFSARNQVTTNVNATDEEKMIAQMADPDFDREAEKILLSRYVPASVTINKDLQVVQFYGSSLNYLHPAAGKASLHLLKMVRDELLLDVRTLIHRVKKEGVAVRKEGIVLSNNGRNQEISIEIIPLRSVSKNPHYLILFKENGRDTGEASLSNPREQTGSAKNGATAAKDVRDRRLKLLEQEILISREQMKFITEESEANREELQSANEEILSSNEELQSINEELETSKEELQSSNEELTTINEELLHRNSELKDAVEYSDAVIQTMTEPLLVLNADMRVRTANRAFYDTFHLRPATIEGHYFYEIGNGQWNVPEFRSKLDGILIADTSLHNFELTHNFPVIGQKTLLFNAMRIGPENGKNRRFLLAIQDITERVNNIRQLNYNKEYFRLLVQNAFDVISIFSPDGTIKYQSESLSRILGYKPEERIGKNVFSDPIVHPDDMHKKRDFFNRCVASPDHPVTQEFRLLHKDGSYKNIDAVCINLLDNEFVNGLVANYRDITRQKALERQKEEFIGIASHELKTPVTSIKGYAQIIQSQLENSSVSELAGFIRKLNSQVNRLTILLSNLLDITKITGGELQLQLSNFDINDLIQEISDEVGQTTSIKFEKELQSCPRVVADKERLGQVITNLLSNAVKYSHKADKVIVRSSFELGASPIQPQISVSVQDFGTGISENDQAVIFERFVRVKDKNTNLIPGLGLGLYIAANIIKRHNGNIWVMSKIDEGSTFGFTLPVTTINKQ
jgi:two-component system, chemotaxis family, CheB/CheR fusion protein